MRRTARPRPGTPRRTPAVSRARRGHPARPTGAGHGGRSDPVAVLSRLTRRDQTLLHLLSEHRVLTTEQITRLLFPNPDRAQRRLLTLYRYGALDRFRHPGEGDGTMTSWRYALGPVGAAVLAAARGTPPPHPATLAARLTRLAAHPRLDHLLGVNDLMATLAAYARTHPGYELALWWGERHAADACGHLVRPDAIALWRHPRGEVLFAVEHDTGTETSARVADKLRGYHDLAAAGGPHLDHATTGGLAVCFHLPALARETHLRPLLETRHTDTTVTGGVPMIVATTIVEFTDHAGPASEVWLPLHSHQRRRLEQLAHIP